MQQTTQNLPQHIISAINLLLEPYGQNLQSLTQKETPLKKFLTVAEAETYCGLRRWTLARRVKTGELKAVKLSAARSGKILIPVAELDKYLRSHIVKSGKK